MKIVHINEGISANSTPNRIRIGQKRCGIQAKLITAHTNVADEDIIVVRKKMGYRTLRKIAAVFEKIEYGLNYSQQANIPFSYYNIGMNLAKEKEILEADIIQLHWICGTFVSVIGIKRLLKLGKPVVWLCHDNWPFTGGCHVRLGCDKYKENCGCCPQLQSKKRRDWSYRLLLAKKKAISNGKLTIVSPSSWMDDNVSQSMLFRGINHYVIPNPIDVSIFAPMDKAAVRGKLGINKEATVLMFGAVNASTTPYKGFKYLLEALDILEDELNPQMNIQAIVFGSDSGEVRTDSRIQIKYLGYLNEQQMAEAYNCADVYMVPSLEDSFNNTVAESLACETPVVAFATGGITDIIDHRINGYLAEYKNAEDLARGVKWVLEEDRQAKLGKAGRVKALQTYDLKVVAKQYIELYKQLLR